MTLRFSSGSVTPFSASQKPFTRVDLDHVNTHVARKRRHHLLRFPVSQHAGIDENAGQLITDCAMQQRSHDAGINTAGKPEDDVVTADLFTDPVDAVPDDVFCCPGFFAATNIVHEALQDAPALRRMGHFRVKLDAIIATSVIGDRRNRRRIGARHAVRNLPAIRRPCHHDSSRHPAAACPARRYGLRCPAASVTAV